MQKKFTNRSYHNGSWLVMLLLSVAIVGAGLTVWNYSQHVFSTRRACIETATGMVRASFPDAITRQLHPHQHGKVTLASSPKTPWRAEIVTVVRGTVVLQPLEQPPSLAPGEACEVTIDTTIPADL
jgi:hypothetical protein